MVVVSCWFCDIVVEGCGDAVDGEVGWVTGDQRLLAPWEGCPRLWRGWSRFSLPLRMSNQGKNTIKSCCRQKKQLAALGGFGEGVDELLDTRRHRGQVAREKKHEKLQFLTWFGRRLRGLAADSIWNRFQMMVEDAERVAIFGVCWSTPGCCRLDVAVVDTKWLWRLWLSGRKGERERQNNNLLFSA